MATKPIQNAGIMSPAGADAIKEKAKADNAKTVDSATAAEKGRAGQQKKDNFDVNISDASRDRAQAMKKAMDIARSTPDIREDRVADLKKKIESGQYQVDAGAIADGMLREAVKEHLAVAEER